MPWRGPAATPFAALIVMLIVLPETFDVNVTPHPGH